MNLQGQLKQCCKHEEHEPKSVPEADPARVH
jgi:hypothetical protein